MEHKVKVKVKVKVEVKVEVKKKYIKKKERPIKSLFIFMAVFDYKLKIFIQ